MSEIADGISSKISDGLKSEALFERAVKVIPGGVNSPVRAFKAVGGSPRFVKSAKNAVIVDVDGNEYTDYVCSWGPMILGHSHPKVTEAVLRAAADGLSFGAATAREVEMAELITEMAPGVDMVRMVNSGTEAVMSALRLARAYTGRDRIVKFNGCYHGHCDSMLVKAGSGALTLEAPDSGGVTEGTARDTLVAEYNHLDSVAELFERYGDEIAAVIVEPVAANMGVVAPGEGFLEGLRRLCDDRGALLIFDEVITGFRLSPGGAQEYYGVRADLATYGKIIGGGMPVGAYGGRRDIMSMVAPVGKVYQAGTLSGNPLAMAAGLATLEELNRNRDIYGHINKLAERLADGIRKITTNTVNQVGSLVCMFMIEEPVTDNRSAMRSDTAAYGRYFNHMLNKGVFIAPAQFEAMFISNAHTEHDIDETLLIMKEALTE